MNSDAGLPNSSGTLKNMACAIRLLYQLLRHPASFEAWIHTMCSEGNTKKKRSSSRLSTSSRDLICFSSERSQFNPIDRVVPTRAYLKMWGHRVFCQPRLKSLRPVITSFPRRDYSSSPDMRIQVTVLGAAGGIGQPLSMLLKMSPLVSELHLVDITHTLGVSADLSHIDTPAAVKGFNGMDSLQVALPGSNVVIIPAGVPRKPGMTRDDLFKVNASIVSDLTNSCARYCPDACIGIISNPVNSTVPIASEVMKLAQRHDPLKIFGVTTLDLVRATAFIAEAKHLHPSEVHVPVIGGHAGKTIVPILSQTKPAGLTFTDEEVVQLTQRIQEAGTEVVMAKAGAGSATLSMAYAGARFAFSLCRALRGEPNVFEWAYVSSVVTDVPYFSSKLLLGKNGIVENLGIGDLNRFEQHLVTEAVKELEKSIAKGVNFVKQRQTEAVKEN